MFVLLRILNQSHVKRSAVFRALLTADMKEWNSGRIELKHISLATGRDLLYVLYKGRMKEGQEESDLMGLLALADQYDMAGLKSLCAVGLAARVTEDNYLEVMNMAQLHNMPLLKAAAVDYIAANAGRLVQEKTTGSTST